MSTLNHVFVLSTQVSAGTGRPRESHRAGAHHRLLHRYHARRRGRAHSWKRPHSGSQQTLPQAQPLRKHLPQQVNRFTPADVTLSRYVRHGMRDEGGLCERMWPLIRLLTLGTQGR